MKKIVFCILGILCCNCLLYADAWFKYGYSKQSSKPAQSIHNTIAAPKNYARINLCRNSFSEWVRYLPVKGNTKVILAYNGKAFSNSFYNVWQVIGLPLLFQSDLEQCADWAYRLWFEYQNEVGYDNKTWLQKYDGTHISYAEWIKINPSQNKKNFFKWCANNSNTFSQKAGLYTLSGEKDLLPGDLIVQNRDGGIGHVSVIFDVCENPAGERLYLIGFSFMPAQECHIEKAGGSYGKDGWFTLEGYKDFLNRYMDVGEPVLRSFISRDSLALGQDSIENWRMYERAVRDSTISIDTSYIMLPAVIEGLQKIPKKDEAVSAVHWSFPVEGYDSRAIGGKDGNGYLPDSYYGVSRIKGYSFFDGNRHGGHPAHDIFIRDANQDSLDDATNKPVFAAAMLDGIVLSTNTEWEKGSKVRGGKYVWCYHPAPGIFTYYAHLNDILVQPGQKILANQRLGTLGRTGLSANSPRSPTHLHLMALKYDGHELQPYNFYRNLLKSNSGGHKAQ